MGPYSLVIFDWDGTLMDSRDRIVRCLTGAMEDLGWPAPPGTEAQQVIGLSLDDAFKHLVPEADESARRDLAARYRDYFLGIDATPMPLFPGVSELLDGIHREGMLMAVATGKSRRGLDRAFDETGLGERFSASRCGDETLPKPNPQMVLEILAQTGVEASDAVMIGDTSFDMEMARNAGVDALGVSYGVHAVTRLTPHGPLGICHSVDDIRDWFQLDGSVSTICASEALDDGGMGVRFDLSDGREALPAFVIRYRGTVYAYLNRCQHLAIELDWSPGEFFDLTRTQLICATHGAIYDPESGRCVSGPCQGRTLERVAVAEENGAVKLVDASYRLTRGAASFGPQPAGKTN